MFVDDIIMYSESKCQLEDLFKTTELFGNDIGMKFGYTKCGEIHIEKGVKVSRNEDETTFKNLIPPDIYKYLGITQNSTPDHKKL